MMWGKLIEEACALSYKIAHIGCILGIMLVPVTIQKLPYSVKHVSVPAYPILAIALTLP